MIEKKVTKIYFGNLRVFLDKVSFRNSIEMGDFTAALDKLYVS